MISRRKFILGASTALTYPVLINSASAIAPVIVGAIRWDAWYSQLGNARQAQNALGPKAYQYRAPWFSEVLNDYQINATGNQANIDSEIVCAHTAGLKYWAYAQYSPIDTNSMFLNAWNLHQTSSIKNLMNWCWIAVSDTLFGATGNFSTQVGLYVSWFQQPNYQKVLNGRPLLYLFFTSVGSSWGNNSNFADMITALRAACVSAGLATPYIVIMGPVPNSGQFLADVGADAISSYLGITPVAQPATFLSMNTTVAAFWDQMVNTGYSVIPICQTGWDTRPRKQNPEPWNVNVYKPPYSGLLNYVTPGTPSEIAAQLQACVNFTNANPTKCPSTAIIIYSWDECDEGGGALIPTLGDPPVNNTTNLLTAIGAILN
jgi:hypothetical protein